MGLAGRKRFEEDFVWEDVIERYFRPLLAERRGWAGRRAVAFLSPPCEGGVGGGDAQLGRPRCFAIVRSPVEKGAASCVKGTFERTEFRPLSIPCAWLCRPHFSQNRPRTSSSGGAEITP